VEAYARDFGDQGDQGARSDERQFVGIDLHRRRSVIVRMDAAGDVLEVAKIVNDVHQLGKVISRAGRAPAVVLEATYGWYWAVDALQAAGAEVHLAHPLGMKAFEYRRVKNDECEVAGACCRPEAGRRHEGDAVGSLQALRMHRASRTSPSKSNERVVRSPPWFDSALGCGSPDGS
jgi:transposase